MFVAWGDESGSVRAKDPDVYLMSGVLAERRVVEELRQAMRALERQVDVEIVDDRPRT